MRRVNLNIYIKTFSIEIKQNKVKRINENYSIDKHHPILVCFWGRLVEEVFVAVLDDYATVG